MVREDPSPTPIKIHGLQRSGTNYLTALIKSNFKDVEVWVNKGGWKHGTWRPTDKHAHIAVISKNPYAWLHSVYRYWGEERFCNIGPDLREVPFEQFVTSRLICEQQRAVPYLMRAANPVQFWNNQYFHWLSCRPQNANSIHIQYEALLEDVRRPLLEIMRTFTLDPVSADLDFRNIRHKCLPSGEEIHMSNSLFEGRYYKTRQYLEFYTPELIDFVNANLDPDVMNLLKYQTLEA